MIERGKIVHIEDNHVEVELTEHEQCESCKLCSTSGGKRRIKIGLDLSHDFKSGQEVVIEISSSETLLGGFFVYILPLMAFIAGAVLGPKIFMLLHLSSDQNLAAVITGFFMLILTLAAVTAVYRSEKKKVKLTPKIRHA